MRPFTLLEPGITPWCLHLWPASPQVPSPKTPPCDLHLSLYLPQPSLHSLHPTPQWQHVIPVIRVTQIPAQKWVLHFWLKSWIKKTKRYTRSKKWNKVLGPTPPPPLVPAKYSRGYGHTLKREGLTYIYSDINTLRIYYSSLLPWSRYLSDWESGEFLTGVITNQPPSGTAASPLQERWYFDFLWVCKTLTYQTYQTLT